MEIAKKTAPPSTGFLNNLAIKTRLLLGFSAVLLVMLTLSGFAYNGFVNVSRDIDEYAGEVEEASLIAKIERQFLKLRTHAREYAASGRETDAKAVHAIADDLAVILAEAKTKLSQPKHVEELAHLAEALDAYLANFKRSEELMLEFKQLIHSKLEKNGEQIVADLDALIRQAEDAGHATVGQLAAEARKHALQARLFSNILIGRKDETFGQKTKAEFARLHAAVDALADAVQSDAERRLHAETKRLLDDYETVFGKVYADERAIRGLIDGEMAEAAATIVKDAEHLLEEFKSMEAETRQKAVDHIVLAELEMLIAAAVGFGGGLLLAWLLGSAISKPVVSMTGAMQQIADGNLNIEVPALGQRDEIGRMANALAIFKANTEERYRLEAEQKEAEARAAAERRQMMLDLADKFEGQVGDVINAVGNASTQLKSNSTTMSSAAEQAQTMSNDVSAASEQASTNVQTVATATEELASSVEEINRQVAHSTSIAGQAVDQVEETNATIDSLNRAAEEVGQVIELITDIAAKTNLLSLNATIEAARAGDAGKGFAVVANEVKNLAEQTARATDEIASQIANIQGATGSAVQAVEAIGRTINEMTEISSAIAAALEQQGTATKEIARNVQEAAQGTEMISRSIVEVSDASTQTGATADEVLGAANDLFAQSENLSSRVEHFLDELRAA